MTQALDRWDYRVVSIWGPQQMMTRVVWGPAALDLDDVDSQKAFVDTLNDLSDGGYSLQRAPSQVWDTIHPTRVSR